jgi:lipoprotein-anchoring transpeptidase ErfK/SrfK
MFNDFRAVCAAIGLAIVTAGAPAVAQYAPPGSDRYVREQQAPSASGNWADDEDDDDAAPPSAQPGQSMGPPPPFFLPPPSPFFASPSERPPAAAYERGLTSRGYEPDAPMRPPGNMVPNQAPAAAPRSAPSTLASLPPEEQPEQAAKELPPQFKRQLVNYESREPAGTIVIDTANTYLYLVLGGGKALRYGIGVGREGFSWAGAERVSRMAEWPDWHPPAEMIERQPYLPRFMAGGPGNPLGARALYLGKTLYRIHGTNQPSTIGTFVSSGCIRLVNSDIEDLYTRVQVGARVVVLQGGKPPATAAN